MADLTYTGDAAVVDGTAIGAGSGIADIIGALYNDSVAALSTGNGGALRATANRALHVNLRTSAGAEVGTGTQYTEDAALGAVGSGVGTLIIGRAAAAAPTSVSADADAVGIWASRFGALNVILRDTSGAYVTAGGGTQYVGDAAATSTPTGTVSMGLAHAAAPSDVSADNDAVAQWMLRNGSAVVNLASGGTLVTLGSKVSASSLPVVIASDQGAIAVTIAATQATNVAQWGGQALAAAAYPADAESNSQYMGNQNTFPMGWNGTTWDRLRSVLTGYQSVDIHSQGGVALTAAAALADATANPTLAGEAGFGFVYNGSTWDRLREPTADALTNATGILAAGNVLYNASTWDRARSVAGDNQAATGIAAVGNMGLRQGGSTYDRFRASADGAGRQVITLAASATAVTQVSSSASNVTLKASNANRLGITVQNDSTAVLYLKMGATASATSYTVKMVAGAYWEAPYGYTGIIDGIWASANGYAYVTEVTS